MKGSYVFKDLGCVLFCLGNLGPVFSDNAVTTDQDRGAGDSGYRFTVHQLFTKSLVGLECDCIRVGQQHHVQVVGINKTLMCGRRITVYAQDGDAILVKFRLQITEAGGLLDSAGGVVLGIKKQQQPLAGIVLQAMTFAIAPFKIKQRCFLINQ